MARIRLMRTTILKVALPEGQTLDSQSPYERYELGDDRKTLHCYIDFENGLKAAQAAGHHTGSTQYGDLVRHWQRCNQFWADQIEKNPTVYYSHKFFTWRLEY